MSGFTANLFVFLSALLLPAGLSADALISFVIDPAVTTVSPGGIVESSGTVINKTPNREVLLGLEESASSPLIVTVGFPIFKNFPVIAEGDEAGFPALDSGASYTGSILTYQIDPHTPVGLYSSTVKLLFGDPLSEQVDAEPQAVFEINVVAVPEPATAGLLVVVLAGGVVLGGTLARRSSSA